MCPKKQESPRSEHTSKTRRHKPMLEMKTFSRLLPAMFVCLGFLSLAVIGDAQSQSPTIPSERPPTFESNQVEDVDLMTRGIWVAQWYLYPKHLQPTVSLYGYRRSDIQDTCLSSSNNNVGMAAFVWDRDNAVSKTRKLTDPAGLIFIGRSRSYTVEDICSSSEPSKLNQQTKNETEETPSLFVITQRPIPNVLPTHRYVVERPAQGN